MTSLVLLFRLRDQVVGLFDLHDEVVIGEHILLDLLNWQLDEHATTLGVISEVLVGSGQGYLFAMLAKIC